jgi:hypothetical protein
LFSFNKNSLHLLLLFFCSIEETRFAIYNNNKEMSYEQQQPLNNIIGGLSPSNSIYSFNVTLNRDNESIPWGFKLEGLSHHERESERERERMKFFLNYFILKI